jgi:hypothetical protein
VLPDAGFRVLQFRDLFFFVQNKHLTIYTIFFLIEFDWFANENCLHSLHIYRQIWTEKLLKVKFEKKNLIMAILKDTVNETHKIIP